MTDPNFPALQEFPDREGHVGDFSMEAKIEGFGIITAQDGEDYHQISVGIALGPRPQDGFTIVMLDAAAARLVADHLYHLANYAELGVESEPL